MALVDKDVLFSRSDVWLFISMLILSCASSIWIFSSAIDSVGNLTNIEWIKQIIWILLGFTLFFFLSLFDYTRLREAGIVMYLVTLFLLVLVLVIGAKVNGSKSWLGFGPFGIQPSELAKFTAILNLAIFLDSKNTQAEKMSDLAFMALISLPLFTLIAFQPDAGSASVLIAIFFIMAFLAGANMFFILNSLLVAGFTAMFVLILVYNNIIAERSFWFANILTISDLTIKFLVFLFAVFGLSLINYIKNRRLWSKILMSFTFSVIIATGISFLANNFLKPYQMMRLATFMKPNLDPQGAGYQSLQSINAIGSGGLVGKGFLQGNHSHLQYLPEQSTDFILSIIGEEAGFLGTSLIVFLMSVIIIRILIISSNANDRFGRYLCYGVFSVFLFHTLINVGMVIGLVPITGIPLLLVSYGGSSILLAFGMLGIVNSVNLRRYKN